MALNKRAVWEVWVQKVINPSFIFAFDHLFLHFQGISHRKNRKKKKSQKQTGKRAGGPLCSSTPLAKPYHTPCSITVTETLIQMSNTSHGLVKQDAMKMQLETALLIHLTSLSHWMFDKPFSISNSIMWV